MSEFGLEKRVDPPKEVIKIASERSQIRDRICPNSKVDINNAYEISLSNQLNI